MTANIMSVSKRLGAVHSYADMTTSAIRFYNTMTQRIEDSTNRGRSRSHLSLRSHTYDHAHAGHARTYIAFDVLVRFLRARGFKVSFVRT